MPKTVLLHFILTLSDTFLQLKSVFDTSIMPHTNYTYDFKGMIDYIFYPTRTMKPLGYLGPISQEWLDENKVVGCPHPHITSGTSGIVQNGINMT
jgi:mRNA deadenylase 3'-5' endonuclease subunit Ccr4